MMSKERFLFWGIRQKSEADASNCGTAGQSRKEEEFVLFL
jgi:hypothetical protein